MGFNPTHSDSDGWSSADTPKQILNRSVPQIWAEALEIIRGRVNSQSFKTWFEPIVPIKSDRGQFTVQVPSQFFSEWLEEHYFSLINEALTRVSSSEITVDYIVPHEEVDFQTNDSVATPLSLNNDNSPANTVEVSERSPIVNKKSAYPGLNPRYTFDNYIKGESNQFARAAAYAVANNPGGTSFNPLIIYGGVGLGKTHLVQAIGNHLLQSGKNQRVLYLSSEKFTIDFVEAIQKDSVSEFSNFYRNADLLLVDDIQFFAGKEKTQDYFFHTFNALHQAGKQIVLSCDKPPKDLTGLNERLISRFQWGLTADIQPPELEMRIAILRKKSSDDGVDLPQEVVEFLAENITTNIRELEGCLIGLLARASLENRKIDMTLAKDVIRYLVGEVRSHITIEEIQRIVCDYFGLPDDLIRAKTRKQEVVMARQIAMFLAKELTNSSLKTIGLHFGGRDHSTVIHAYQTIEDSMNTDPRQRLLVAQIRASIEKRLR